MSREEFKAYLDYVVECAFREGVLWERLDGDKPTMNEAITSAQLNILELGRKENANETMWM